VTNLQVEFAEVELLAQHPFEAPLIAGGVRCHGGFDGDGKYMSPRTLNRIPAIRAWQLQREEQFNTPILDVALERWPEHFPNVPQAKFLIANAIREPIISTLTRVGTIEGFGGGIRYSAIKNMQEHFDEEIRGCAMDHLDRGLFEAHARDEAGYEEEGGHKQMWFAARDVAFESPVDEADIADIMKRMGFGGAPQMTPEEARALALQNMVFPDIALELEQTIQRMVRLLLIEISAYHTFAWAEEVLSDRKLVAGAGAASALVSYIRQDESPHVEYLKTVLSEMRDRTFKGQSGKNHEGTKIITKYWETALADSLGARRQGNIQMSYNEILHALQGKPKAKDILAEFHSLGSIRPDATGEWKPINQQEAGY
jgi:hypothetical protein